MADALPVFVLWERVTHGLFDRTARFPKVMRHSVSARIEGLALDVLEALAEARYATGEAKRRRIGDASRGLSRLRVLVRFAHGRRWLDHGAYEQLSRDLDDAGRQIGGWLESIGRVRQ